MAYTEGKVMVSFQISPELRKNLRIKLLEFGLELGHTLEAFTEVLIRDGGKNPLIKAITERSRYLSGKD